jgi:hypothetical protein
MWLIAETSGMPNIHSLCLRERIGRKRDTTISPAGLTFVSSILISSSLVIAANMRFYSISKDVNRRLPGDAQISLFFQRWKIYEVLRLHAEMYPDSSKRWQAWTLVVVGAVILFAGFFASATLPH